MKPIGRPVRTLVLTVHSAFPPISGADLRNYQNATGASQFGPVLLVSAGPLRESRPADGLVQLAALARKDEPRGASLNPWRSRAEARLPRDAAPRLQALVQAFRPDTIIVEGIALSALIGPLRPLARSLILDMHNVESVLARDIYDMRLRERLLPYRWTNRGRIRRLEHRALKTVDRVWVCSEIERDRLASLFDLTIPADVVPNGIPRTEALPEHLPAIPGREEGWPVMLFVGNLEYPPNVTAAERLIERVLPRVKQALPAARAIIAGRDPGSRIVRLASLPDVELVADPASLSGLLRRSHVSVMPISAGGGTRFKTLEAMAWGLPVVATAIAAEGQGFVDGEEILIADTDEDLARQVISLCNQPDRMDLQRRLAYENTRLRFSTEAIGRAIRRGLGQVDADV